jgi:arylsulfatase A-like enzyme
MKIWNKVKFLFGVLVLVFSGCGNKHNTKSSAKPNVLFICVDDLRPQLGCYGNDYMKTPHLDGLASKGTVFTNHFVQVPTCGASRYSMLTGTRPSKPGHLSNHAIINELSNKPEGALPETFIHHFRRNNYYTVGIGKVSHQVDGLIYEYEEAPSNKKELPYSWDEMLFNSGKWKTGWNAFFAYADGSNRQSMKRQVKPYECSDVEDEGYPDGLSARLAIEKLRELKDKKQAFFLGVGFFKPHLPFNAPKKYWDMYNRDEIPLSPNPDAPENTTGISLHGSSEFNGYQKGEEKAAAGKRISDDYARTIRHAYFASVSYVDAQIGKVLQELEKLDLEENTIVVVWGDHGWHLGDQSMWGKHSTFEKALRSALIIKVPGTKASGSKANGLVESVDLYPTLCDLCGIAIPENLDGVSLAPVFDDPGYQAKQAAYSYWNNGITVRTERYRLSRFNKKGKEVIELYDHLNDPNESVNVAGDNPEKVKELMPILRKGNKGLVKNF